MPEAGVDYSHRRPGGHPHIPGRRRLWRPWPAVLRRQWLRFWRLLCDQSMRGPGRGLRRRHRWHLQHGCLRHLRRPRANLLRKHDRGDLHRLEHPLSGRQLRGLRQRGRPHVLSRAFRRGRLHQSHAGVQRQRLHPLRRGRTALLPRHQRVWRRRLLLRRHLPGGRIGLWQHRGLLYRGPLLGLRRSGPDVLWPDSYHDPASRCTTTAPDGRYLRGLRRSRRALLRERRRLRRRARRPPRGTSAPSVAAPARPVAAVTSATAAAAACWAAVSATARPAPRAASAMASAPGALASAARPASAAVPAAASGTCSEAGTVWDSASGSAEYLCVKCGVPGGPLLRRQPQRGAGCCSSGVCPAENGALRHRRSRHLPGRQLRVRQDRRTLLPDLALLRGRHQPVLERAPARAAPCAPRESWSPRRHTTPGSDTCGSRSCFVPVPAAAHLPVRDRRCRLRDGGGHRLQRRRLLRHLRRPGTALLRDHLQHQPLLLGAGDRLHVHRGHGRLHLSAVWRPGPDLLRPQ